MNAVAVEPPVETPPTPADTHEVVTRFKDLVYRIALTHTKRRDDADDVFQEVFLTYHRKRPACRDDEHLKAWLIVTTRNCARRVVLNSWRNRVVPIRPQDAELVADEKFSFATAEQDAIFRELGKLNDVYRTVLHLFYFEDLPVAEIAALLGLETGAVKMRLSRGRALLRIQLQGGYFDE